MTESKVFVIDDDPAVRDSLLVLLEAEGFAVESFPSAEAFLATGSTRGPGCALVDVRMPGMSGLELLKKLAAAGSTLSVVVMTGHGDVPMAVEAMRSGARDFIEKPFDPDTLIASLRQALKPPGPAAGPGDSAALIRLGDLTPREREVLDHLVAGNPNKVIAHALDISSRTVEIHRARVMDKMQAKSLSHLVRMALAAGLRPPSL